MRLVMFAAALAGLVSLSACNFLTPSGAAAATWERLEAGRAAKLAEKTNPPPPGAKKICKSIVPIGSIMPQKVCSTESEWAEFDAETGKTVDTFNQLRRSGALAPATEGSQFQAE
jgi:hypothetical protein